MPSPGLAAGLRAPALPDPDEVRALSQRPDHTGGRQPPPVAMPSRGLLVKYGADVSVDEAVTQAWVRERLLGRVPVPEVYGWTRDRGQTFIYMALVHGVPLHEAWPDLAEAARQAVCDELREAVAAWRRLEQGKREHYIGEGGGAAARGICVANARGAGSVNKQPLHDTMFRGRPELAGPFEGAEAVQRFQEACALRSDGDEPVVFTHNHLVASNILVSPGPRPRLMALVDWGQAGWYPAYWEYCKARYARAPQRRLSHAPRDELPPSYLALILDPVEAEWYWRPWLYLALTSR